MKRTALSAVDFVSFLKDLSLAITLSFFTAIHFPRYFLSIFIVIMNDYALILVFLAALSSIMCCRSPNIPKFLTCARAQILEGMRGLMYYLRVIFSYV